MATVCLRGALTLRADFPPVTARGIYVSGVADSKPAARIPNVIMRRRLNTRVGAVVSSMTLPGDFLMTSVSAGGVT